MDSEAPNTQAEETQGASPKAITEQQESAHKLRNAGGGNLGWALHLQCRAQPGSNGLIYRSSDSSTVTQPSGQHKNQDWSQERSVHAWGSPAPGRAALRSG